MFPSWRVSFPTSRVLDGFGKKLFWRLLFMLGLYMCSFPREKDARPSTPGFFCMPNLTNSFKLWHSFETIMVLWAMISDTLLQSLFTSNVLRHMPKISFSLYLVYGPGLHLLSYSFVLAFHSFTGDDKEILYQLRVLLTFISLTLVMLRIADVFWRGRLPTMRYICHAH